MYLQAFYSLIFGILIIVLFFSIVYWFSTQQKRRYKTVLITSSDITDYLLRTKFNITHVAKPLNHESGEQSLFELFENQIIQKMYFFVDSPRSETVKFLQEIINNFCSEDKEVLKRVTVLLQNTETKDVLANIELGGGFIDEDLCQNIKWYEI